MTSMDMARNKDKYSLYSIYKLKYGMYAIYKMHFA